MTMLESGEGGEICMGGGGGDEVKGTRRRREGDQEKGRDQAGAQGVEGKRTSKRVEGQKIRF